MFHLPFVAHPFCLQNSLLSFLLFVGHLTWPLSSPAISCSFFCHCCLPGFPAADAASRSWHLPRIPCLMSHRCGQKLLRAAVAAFLFCVPRLLLWLPSFLQDLTAPPPCYMGCPLPDQDFHKCRGRLISLPNLWERSTQHVLLEGVELLF